MLSNVVDAHISFIVYTLSDFPGNRGGCAHCYDAYCNDDGPYESNSFLAYHPKSIEECDANGCQHIKNQCEDEDNDYESGDGDDYDEDEDNDYESGDGDDEDEDEGKYQY